MPARRAFPSETRLRFSVVVCSRRNQAFPGGCPCYSRTQPPPHAPIGSGGVVLARMSDACESWHSRASWKAVGSFLRGFAFAFAYPPSLWTAALSALCPSSSREIHSTGYVHPAVWRMLPRSRGRGYGSQGRRALLVGAGALACRSYRLLLASSAVGRGTSCRPLVVPCACTLGAGPGVRRGCWIARRLAVSPRAEWRVRCRVPVLYRLSNPPFSLPPGGLVAAPGFRSADGCSTGMHSLGPLPLPD